MPKGVAGQGLANSGTAQNLSNNLTANAANVYGGLEPELAARAATPTGYTPSQQASMNTAAQQSAGGSNAGAAGQGGLYAARTRNAGAGQAAIGSSTRAAGANLSKAAVGTQVQSANLGQQNQRAALSGMEGLNSTELSGGENALGLSNSALGVANQADANNPYLKIGMGILGAGGQAAQGYLGNPSN
jgi:hypothetical protein